MYKLFINNLQVGNYDRIAHMMESAMMYASGRYFGGIRWSGKSCYMIVREK